MRTNNATICFTKLSAFVYSLHATYEPTILYSDRSTNTDTILSPITCSNIVSILSTIDATILYPNVSTFLYSYNATYHLPINTTDRLP